MHSTPSSNESHKAALTVGFVAATLAVVAAYTTPATGYELSIYQSTPLAFWVGIAIGLITSLVVALNAHEWRRGVDAALGLATYCVLAVIAIPLLRSYHFYGAGDSMTHLGWAREIQAGTLDPANLLYPAIHVMSVFLGELTPLGSAYGLKFVPLVLFPLVFVVGMALCVRLITDSRLGLIIGVFSALLLIPINNISIHIFAHPSSQGVLFLPILFYFMLKFITGSDSGFSLTTPAGAAFLLIGIGLVFIHPQQSMILVSMLAAIALLQAVVRQFSSGWIGNHPAVTAIRDHRPIYLHTLVIGAVFLAWSSQHERVRDTTAFVVDSLLTGSTNVLGETAERGASLMQLGGSFEELFLKLFMAAGVFGAIAAALFLVTVLGWADRTKHRRNALISYLGFGLVPVSAAVLLVFLAPVGDHYTRFLGFIFVPITILGAVGLAESISAMETRIEGRATSVSRSHLFTVVAVVFVLFLGLQLAVVHQSPYIYQPNQQIGEADVNGYGVAFEYHDDETPMLSLRAGPHRFVDAHFGSNTANQELEFPGYKSGVPGDVFSTNVTTHYDQDMYLVVRQSNRDREVTLYQELRYSADGFRTLETDSRVNQVQHNGEFKLYRIADDE